MHSRTSLQPSKVASKPERLPYCAELAWAGSVSNRSVMQAGKWPIKGRHMAHQRKTHGSSKEAQGRVNQSCDGQCGMSHKEGRQTRYIVALSNVTVKMTGLTRMVTLQ